MNKISRIFVLFLLYLTVLSCEHKELCFDHSHIVNLKVVFDWKHSPDANPESMSFYLFSEDGTNPQRYELSGREGGTIRVTPGVYHAVCLNSDTRNIDCRDKEHLSSFLITTKDEDASSIATSLGVNSRTLPRTKGTEDERIAREPEMLWTDNLFNFQIKEKRDNQITLLPKKSLVRISIHIYNVQNLRYVSAIRGTLSGLSEGILAGDGMRNTVCVTVPFSLAKDEAGGTLSAQLLSFGDCPSGNEHHYINLYLVLSDGSKWNYSYDVTPQLHNAENSKHINIVLDELPIPEPENVGGEGGFIPTIGGWNSVDIGIKM